MPMLCVCAFFALYSAARCLKRKRERCSCRYVDAVVAYELRHSSPSLSSVAAAVVTHCVAHRTASFSSAIHRQWPVALMAITAAYWTVATSSAHHNQSAPPVVPLSSASRPVSPPRASTFSSRVRMCASRAASAAARERHSTRNRSDSSSRSRSAEITRATSDGPSLTGGGAHGLTSAGFGVQGSGFRAQGSGFRLQGSGFRVQGSGFMIYGLGVMLYGLG